MSKNNIYVFYAQMKIDYYFFSFSGYDKNSLSVYKLKDKNL